MSDFATVEQAIEDIKNGKMIVVVDDEDRENEGDLIVAAATVTPEDINFMATYAKGLICTPIDGKRLDELNIGQMVVNNTDNHETAFTVSIDAYDTETGISAFERCHTIKKLLDPKAKPASFRRPGTSSRCAPSRAACCAAPATRRRRRTSRASRASTRPASAARSWTTTAT